MKKSGHIVCVLAAIALLYGCEWNSSLYEKYVNEEEGGTVASCHGACGGEITEENCRKVNGNWISGKCDGVDAGDTALTKLQCREKGGLWYDAYCQVNINDIDTCKNAGGVWGQYTMLDLGAGIYIRKIESDDQPARYICGSYTLVINDDPNASTCSDEQLETFNQALEYQLCPKGKSCQLAYQKTEATDDAVAICSSCPQNNVMCRNADQSFSCTNLDNDPKNCGACGAFCESDYTCIEGICVYSKVKVCDSKLVQCGAEPNGDPLCYDPSSFEHCGAICNENDELETLTCPENSICKKNDLDGTYGCFCESGIIINKTIGGKTVEYCVDPTSNDYCGATIENPLGNKCYEGKRCADVDGILRCTCALSWELSCYHQDGIHVDCVDPDFNMQYCGANECSEEAREKFGCDYSSEICKNGNCVCNEDHVLCADECINPQLNNQYCGAKGSCNSADESSENYKGEECKDYRVCLDGDCVCMNEHIECDGTCINPDISRQFCGAKGACNASDANSADYMGQNCGSLKICQNGKCECIEGFVECNGECIDPLISSKNCGAKDTCLGDFAGENCENKGEFCVNGTCVSECRSSEVTCGHSCVDKSIYHVEAGCTKCSDDYCYVGDINNFDYRYCRTPDDSNKLNSNSHCGTCNSACKEGLVCKKGSDGKFACGCPDGQTMCNDVCYDLDNLHMTDCKTCVDGWGDCDGAFGCEIDLTSSLNHCGKCQLNCKSEDFPNASALSCVDKQCGFTSCQAGYGNCDNDSKNGCELHLTESTDVKNCGACGMVCEYPNAAPKCESGECKLGDCIQDYGNCDNDSKNGCELHFPTSSDVNHCGACGNVCNLGHATSKCESGTCQIDSCNIGYENCDSKNDNGCEAHLNTDSQNCGKCGNACTGTYNNASSGCNNGKCEMICNAGYGNCDNRANNGCEKNITNDKNNCGECNLRCDSKYSCGSSRDEPDKCSLACESGTCCVTGRLSRNDTNGDNVVCCSGYELYKYTKKSGCTDSERRGCYKTDPDGSSTKNCWQKVQ